MEGGPVKMELPEGYDENDELNSDASSSPTTDHIEEFMKFVNSTDTHLEGGFLAALSLASHHFHHNDQDEHDVEVENGVATGLATTLRVCVTRQQPRKGRHVRISNVQGMHIAVLASSLATVLQCSDDVLANHVHGFQDDIVLSSEAMTDLFSTWNGDPTIQQVALSSATKIIGYVGPHVKSDGLEQLVGILLKVVNIHSLSPDIRADAAAVVCGLASRHSTRAIPKLEKNASILISTLTTASLPLDDANQSTMLVHLYELANKSEIFQIKMAKRRCTIMAISSSLKSTENVKNLAVQFCQGVFSNPECTEWFSAAQGDNFDILANHLIEFVRDEESERLQVAGVSLLQKILSMDTPNPDGLLATLKCLAYGGESDDVIRDAALAYCEAIRKEAEPGVDSLSTLVDFTTFPFSQVRAKGLRAIEWVTAKSDWVKALLNQTDMIDNFALIVRHGSKEDCTTALNIMRKLARSSLYHMELCAHVGFLREVIDFVTRENVSNRSAHFYAVEMVLALLSNDNNTEVFLPFRDLLPWLVSFLNKTTADDDFKQPVVSVIVRLSQAYLNDI